MKLAVATEGDMVSGHFGRCENFTVCSVEDGRVSERQIINTEGNQHSALPVYLDKLGVNVVISGGAGSGAVNSLSQRGIKILTGVQGKVDEAIESYLKGELDTANAVCSEHEHHHGSNDGSCQCGSY